jgi:hypothetical protein
LCRKVGVLTQEEEKEFEEGFERLVLFEMMGGKQCPYCKNCVIKPKGLNSDRVRCPGCKNPDFCFSCR